ncbi:tetratricopeptide repeat protein [Saccharicrinis fermentans]|nr:tetratricopeptide repeat protein [Saccharicrinis fermentans]
MYRLKEALQILQRIEDRHKDSLKSIHCLIYEYMGRYYQQINQPPKAINYFKKAIFAIDSFEAHISNKVEVLLNISQLYADLGNTKQAYKYLLQSKQLNDSVFSSTSDRNKELFEIKNEYESQLRKHEATLKNQKLTMLEQEKSLWLLKLIIIASIFVFIEGGVVFYKVLVWNDDL